MYRARGRGLGNAARDGRVEGVGDLRDHEADELAVAEARLADAARFGTNSSSSMAAKMRSRVLAATFSGRLIALDTVPDDTPSELGDSCEAEVLPLALSMAHSCSRSSRVSDLTGKTGYRLTPFGCLRSGGSGRVRRASGLRRASALLGGLAVGEKLVTLLPEGVAFG